MANGLIDPATFASAAGKAQEDNDAVSKFYLTWTRLYVARFGPQKVPALTSVVARYHPAGHRFLGGDVTAMLGVP